MLVGVSSTFPAEYINVIEWRSGVLSMDSQCRTILQPIAASVVEKKFLSNAVAAVSRKTAHEFQRI